MSRRRQHVVKPRETIVSISKNYGYSGWKELWDHAINRPIKNKRKKAECIEPGDVLNLPLPKEFEKRLDGLLVEMSQLQNRLAQERAGNAEVVKDLQFRVRKLTESIKAMDSVLDNYIKRTEGAMERAKEARDIADFAQIFLGATKVLAKVTVRHLAKDGGKLARNFDDVYKKQAENLRRDMGRAGKDISDAELKDMLLTKGFIKEIVGANKDFALEIVQRMMEGDSLIKRALEFYDDATSYGHYLWVLTRGAMGGGWSWDSIEDDAKKKIAELRKEAEGYKAEIDGAIRAYTAALDRLKDRDAVLTAAIDEIEMRATKIVGCMAD